MRNRKIRGNMRSHRENETNTHRLQLFEGLAEWDFDTLFLVHLWHQLLGDFFIIHNKGSSKVKTKPGR